MSAPLDPDTFREAAQLIRSTGLSKKMYHSAMQPGAATHCTLGALMTVKGQPHCSLVVEEEAKYLSGLLGREEEAGLGTVIWWNDHPDRTPDEVVTLLEQAAEKLEADCA